MKKHCLLIAAMLSCGLANAQTDMTGKITNPSFEVNKFEGWVNEGMSCQTNSVFKKRMVTFMLRNGLAGEERLATPL